MSTLGEELPKEMARCREVLVIYKSIPLGAFGAMHIEHALKIADEAVMSGDLVRMIAAYEDLRGIE